MTTQTVDFRAMDAKLMDDKFVFEHVAEVEGYWVFDWSGTEFEAGVKALFDTAALPTPYTGLTAKQDVCLMIQNSAKLRVAEGR